MSKKKPLLIKIVIGISLILFGIIFTTIYKIDSLVQEIIVLKLNNSLRDNSHSLYDYELKNVNTNFIKGNFKINNFKIFIKPKALDSLQKNNILKRQLFEIEFHSLLIKGVDIKHFLSEEEMIANEIALISPEINIFYNSAATNLPTNKLDLDSIFSKIDPSISIKKVNLSNANLKIFDTQQDSLNTFGLSGFSFIMKDLMINSSTIMQPLKFTYSSFTCGGGDTQFHINEDYSLKINDFNYKSEDKQLLFEDVVVQHILTKEEFKKENPDDTPFYDISFNKLNINLSIGDLLLNNDIELKHVIIEQLNLFIYQSKLKNIRPKKVKPLLASLIKKINSVIYIGQIDLKACDITYEYEEKSMDGKVLKLSFDNSDITIKNLTNHPTYLEKNHTMEIIATSYFLNKGLVNISSSFDLTSEIDQFHIKGRLNKMDIKETNQLVEVFAPIKFTKGDIHSLDFKFDANSYSSTGTVDFNYSNIKFNIQKENDNTLVTYIPIMSLIANNLVRSNNNPEHKKYKQGIIKTDHDKHKSILNYVWQSIKTGLISTISHSKNK